MYYTSSIAPIYPAFVRVVDAAGNVIVKKDQYGHDGYDYGINDYGGLGTRPFMSNGNPLGANLYNQVKSIGDQLKGTFMADIPFTARNEGVIRKMKTEIEKNCMELIYQGLGKEEIIALVEEAVDQLLAGKGEKND